MNSKPNLKFEGSLKPLSKTLKQEENEKKNAEWKMPEKKNRETS